MREITAYETSDGKLFNDERTAQAHQADIIGELLDSLVAQDARGNISRFDRHSMLMETLKQTDLADKVARLHYAIQHSVNDE